MRALAEPFAPFIHFGRTLAGRENAEPETFAQRRRYCLGVVAQGRVSLRRGEEELRLAADDCFLLPPRSGWQPAMPAAAEIELLVFDVVHRPRAPARGGRSWYGSGDDCQPAPRELWDLELPIAVPAAMAATCRRCLREALLCWWLSPLDHLQANALLARWLLSYLAALQPGGSDGGDAFARAERWARHALGEGCTVASMAAAVGMERSRFTTDYTRRRGRTPGQFLLDLRLTMAARLLADGLRLGAVARRVGYRRTATFVERFRARFGEHPARWRGPAG